MAELALGAPGARALLVGTGTHVAGSALPEVAAVRGTIADLGEALVRRCGMAPAAVRALTDPRDPIEVGEALRVTAAEADEVLLLYYVGHGLVSAGDDLYLATRITDHHSTGLAYKAFPYAAVRDALRSCRAESIAVVLDCCFSGRAGAAFGPPVGGAFDLPPIHGSFVLASAAPEEAALAPPGQRHTAFTGELLRLLREGDPGGPPLLTLDHLYRRLCRVLPARGLPEPHRRAADRAGDLVVAPNPAVPARSEDAGDGVQRTGDAAEDARGTAGAGTAGSADGRSPGEEATCPYRGLERFEAEDAPYFFGRERLTADLLRRVSALPARSADRAAGGALIAVVGASGAGKSSLLRAGLLPAIRRGGLHIAGSRRWPWLVVTPGDRPMRTLAARLARPAGQPGGGGGAAVEPATIVALAREGLRRQGVDGRLVLVIDQFEELFTAGADESERRLFIRTIDALSRNPEPGAIAPSGRPPAAEPDRDAPALVVLAIRADFYGRCLDYPELLRPLRSGPVVIGPMATDELRGAIEGPARASGLSLAGGLVDVVLRDLRAGQPATPAETPGTASGVASGTDALPLLSYALLATWQRRTGRTLTVAGYQAAGGIWEAVPRHAELTFAALDPEAQRQARALLLRLVHVVEGAGEVRRRVAWADLVGARAQPQAAAMERAHHGLAAARLITVYEDGTEITHEALLRAWPRLRRWIDAERAGLLVRQRVQDDATAWHRDGRDPGGLYRGVRLAVARDWAADEAHRAELGPTERQFLEASVAEAERELAAARRRAKARRLVTGVLATLLLLALVATGVALWFNRVANQRRLEAESGRIAAVSDLLGATDPRQSLLLAGAAWEVTRTTTARSALLNTQASPFIGVLTGHTGAVQQLRFSPDGRTLASAGQDGTVRLWDLATHRGASLKVGDGESVNDVAFTADGQVFATASTGGAVRLWDVATREPIGEPLMHDGAAVSVVFSPDGRVMATSDGVPRLWDLETGRRVGQPLLGQPLLGHTERVVDLAFSPDGETLATASLDGTARLWKVAGGEQIGAPLAGHTGAVFGVAVSPDGKTVATASLDHTLRLWSAATGRQRGAPLVGHRFDVFDVAFSPDGSTLASASRDRTVLLWDAATGERRSLRLTGHSAEVFRVAVSPDGRTLASGGVDGNVLLWRPPPAPLSGQQHVSAAEFSQDRATVATTSENGTVRLWEVGTGRQIGAPIEAGRAGRGVAFSPDGRVVATASESGIWLSRSGTGRQDGAPIEVPNGGYALAFSPDGATLAVSVVGDSPDADDWIELWDVESRRRVGERFIAGEEPLRAVTFSPDGRLVAAGDQGGAIHLWDARTGGSMGAPLTGHTHIVFGLRFSPDGKTLASASADQTLRLWDVAARRPAGAPLTGHTGEVMSVAFGGDGDLLVSSGLDETIRVWRTADGAPLAVLGGELTEVGRAADFAPDGTVVGVSAYGGLLRWDLDPERVRRKMCDQLHTDLTRQEWSALIPDLDYSPVCR